MNLLILTNTWPSPSEVFIKNLVDGLLERNVSITVLCKKAKGYRSAVTYGGNGLIRYFISKQIIITIIRLLLVYPFFVIKQPKAFLSLCIHLAYHHDLTTLLAPLAWYPVRNKQFDAIHCQFGYLGNIGLVLKKTGIVSGPVISSFRGSDISSYLRRKPAVYRVLKEKGDLFLPVSTAFSNRLASLGFPEERIRVYHSAIDLKQFPFRLHNPVKSNIKTLFCAGRLVEKKGFAYAIEALRELLKKNADYKLVIAGDGPLADELHQKTLSEGVSEKVIFSGWISQDTMAELLENAVAFLATNIESRSGDTDGIPNIVKEAMALGVPVVAFDHPGLEELITHRSNGLLVPSRNVSGIVSAVEELANEKMRKEICYNARQTIEHEYSKEIQAKYLDELIQEYSKV